MKRLLLSITFLSFLFIGSKSVDAQPIPGGGISPVITEIMYNPPESGQDSLEFIEILNPSLTSPINMTGYYIEDAFDYAFPDGFVLASGEHAIISGDSVIFEATFGVEAFQWEGAANQLSNSGESITLKNGAGVVVDSVDYGTSSMWPQEANGDGYSIVLCDPSADNNLPENWTASENATGVIVNTLEIYADPDDLSTCTTVGISELDKDQVLVFPNPSNGNFRVQFEAGNEASVLHIYNTVGQVVVTESVAAGIGSIQLNTELKTGHYFLSIENGNNIERQKLIVQ